MNESSPLVIAIQNKHLLMIEFMFEQICKADECLVSNVMRHVLQSQYSKCKTILAALIDHGLHSIIAYLLILNQNSNIAIFSSFDISYLQNLLKVHRSFCAMPVMQFGSVYPFVGSNIYKQPF